MISDSIKMEDISALEIIEGFPDFLRLLALWHTLTL